MRHPSEIGGKLREFDINIRGQKLPKDEATKKMLIELYVEKKLSMKNVLIN